MFAERVGCADFISAHQSGVASDISRQHRRQSSLYPPAGHEVPPPLSPKQFDRLGFSASRRGQAVMTPLLRCRFRHEVRMNKSGPRCLLAPSRAAFFCSTETDQPQSMNMAPRPPVRNRHCSARLSVRRALGVAAMDFVEWCLLVLATTGFGLMAFSAWLWLG